MHQPPSAAADRLKVAARKREDAIRTLLHAVRTLRDFPVPVIKADPAKDQWLARILDLDRLVRDVDDHEAMFALAYNEYDDQADAAAMKAKTTTTIKPPPPPHPEDPMA